MNPNSKYLVAIFTKKGLFLADSFSIKLFTGTFGDGVMRGVSKRD